MRHYRKFSEAPILKKKKIPNLLTGSIVLCCFSVVGVVTNTFISPILKQDFYRPCVVRFGDKH